MSDDELAYKLKFCLNEVKGLSTLSETQKINLFLGVVSSFIAPTDEKSLPSYIAQLRSEKS